MQFAEQCTISGDARRETVTGQGGKGQDDIFSGWAPIISSSAHRCSLQSHKLPQWRRRTAMLIVPPQFIAIAAWPLCTAIGRVYLGEARAITPITIARYARVILGTAEQP
jgi:hypothetical protein